MTDRQPNVPTSLLAAAKPDLETAPLVVSSDVLVLMLRFVGTLRSLLQVPAIDSAPASSEMKATVLDMERSVTALLN